MYLLKNFIISILSTAGFAVILKVPKKSIFLCSLCGSIGWMVYILAIQNDIDIINSNLYSSIVIALLSEIFARINKEPVTIFIIPGIFCIVPGYGIYNTMKSLMDKNYSEASMVGFETMFIAGAIATGIIIVSSIFKIINKYKKKY